MKNTLTSEQQRFRGKVVVWSGLTKSRNSPKKVFKLSKAKWQWMADKLADLFMTKPSLSTWAALGGK